MKYLIMSIKAPRVTIAIQEEIVSLFLRNNISISLYKCIDKLIVLMLLLHSISIAQEREKRIGTITHISSQHVYVQFDKTNSINIGDTLYLSKNRTEVPALIVKFISSRSCAGEPLVGISPNIDDRVIVYLPIEVPTKIVVPEKNDSTKGIVSPEPKTMIPSQSAFKIKKNYKGRFSVQSSSNLNNNSPNIQRWRYTLSFNADSIGGGPLSFSNYMFFTYNTNDWQNVKSNLGKALKIYDLNITYSFRKESKLTLGRSLNNKISSIGSIDGLQYQHKVGRFYLGGLVGSHPNFSDYGYNSKMFEYGFYINRLDTLGISNMENTIAFFNQTNDFKTDRRYLYLQHTNNIIKSTNFFASSEIDLFKKENGINKNNLTVTSIFLNLYVNPTRFFSFSFSYDARRNVVYYETYKSFIDSLFSNEMNQGFRTGLNLRPFNNLSLSLNGGYRFQKNDTKPARNFNGNLYYGNIPLLNVSGNISYTKLISSYTDGNIAGIRLSKYITSLDMNISTDYRRIEYKFSGGSTLIQNNLSADFSYKLPLDVYLGLNYEVTFEKQSSYSRLFVDITKRF
ncbi:MAG: hypothetical protein AB1521_06965 [Bacteroidota bacterium]